MRILELQAPYFRALWRREHEVIAWGSHSHCDLRATRELTRLSDVLRALPPGWRPDLILLGDDSRLLRVLGLEDPPCPTIMMSVDAHHHAGWHAPLASAFDLVFLAQRDYLPAYAAAGAPHTEWLPLWAPDVVPAPVEPKTHQVSFVGTLDPRLNPERVALVDALRPRLPLHVGQGRWEDVFARSRIVLNQAVRGDLNFRVFEALACGALLLTERIENGLADLFTDGEHLATYPAGDVSAIVTTAERWLADERARREVAARGRERVLAAHRESHRAGHVLGTATRISRERPAPVRCAGVARTYCLLAHYAERLATRIPGFARLRLASAQYLAAAAELVTTPTLAEPDRRAVLGMVALERGDLPAARDHLDWVATRGGRPEDHLARIEALVRAGALPAAREAAATLRATHPTYTMGTQLAAALRLMSGDHS